MGREAVVRGKTKEEMWREGRG